MLRAERLWLSQGGIAGAAYPDFFFQIFLLGEKFIDLLVDCCYLLIGMFITQHPDAAIVFGRDVGFERTFSFEQCSIHSFAEINMGLGEHFQQTPRPRTLQYLKGGLGLLLPDEQINVILIAVEILGTKIRADILGTAEMCGLSLQSVQSLFIELGGSIQLLLTQHDAGQGRQR